MKNVSRILFVVVFALAMVAGCGPTFIDLYIPPADTGSVDGVSTPECAEGAMDENACPSTGLVCVRNARQCRMGRWSPCAPFARMGCTEPVPTTDAGTPPVDVVVTPDIQPVLDVVTPVDASADVVVADSFTSTDTAVAPDVVTPDVVTPPQDVLPPPADCVLEAFGGAICLHRSVCFSRVCPDGTHQEFSRCANGGLSVVVACPPVPTTDAGTPPVDVVATPDVQPVPDVVTLVDASADVVVADSFTSTDTAVAPDVMTPTTCMGLGGVICASGNLCPSATCPGSTGIQISTCLNGSLATVVVACPPVPTTDASTPPVDVVATPDVQPVPDASADVSTTPDAGPAWVVDDPTNGIVFGTAGFTSVVITQTVPYAVTATATTLTQGVQFWEISPLAFRASDGRMRFNAWLNGQPIVGISGGTCRFTSVAVVYGTFDVFDKRTGREMAFRAEMVDGECAVTIARWPYVSYYWNMATFVADAQYYLALADAGVVTPDVQPVPDVVTPVDASADVVVADSFTSTDASVPPADARDASAPETSVEASVDAVVDAQDASVAVDARVDAGTPPVDGASVDSPDAMAYPSGYLLYEVAPGSASNGRVVRLMSKDWGQLACLNDTVMNRSMPVRSTDANGVVWYSCVNSPVLLTQSFAWGFYTATPPASEPNWTSTITETPVFDAGPLCAQVPGVMYRVRDANTLANVIPNGLCVTSESGHCRLVACP